MESLLQKLSDAPMPFADFMGLLTEKEMALVTKARRMGLIVINMTSGGEPTVRKVVA